MKKVLIIGGNGYIGSRLYDYLLELGYDVDNLDLFWFGKIYSESIEKDFRYLSKKDIENYTHIVLLAGHSSVSMCLDNFYSCYLNNCANFVNLIEKIDDSQILLYSTTCAVYGFNNKLVDENDPIQEALNYYDYSKISMENISKLYPNKKLIGLRFGSVNGFSKNFRNENLINSLSLSTINSNPLVVSNGDAMRSVLGMSDACRAIETIIKNDGIKNRIYNITSINNSIINFALKIKELTNSELIINDSFKTDYSFNCSNKLFSNDYDFEFTDTTETIFEDIINNNNKIVFNSKRNKIIYE